MFWNNFIELCSKKGTTPTAVVEELHMAAGSITKWKNGTVPRDTTLQKIADYFNVSVDFLKSKDISDLPGAEKVDVAYYPVIGSVKAGYGGQAIEEDTGEIIPILLDSLRGYSREDFFVLRVKGNSMAPKILNGDKVLVLRTQDVESGSIAVVLYDGDEATVKKISYEPGCDYIDLLPINNKYEPMRIKGEALAECHILGQVVSLYRDMGF